MGKKYNSKRSGSSRKRQRRAQRKEKREAAERVIQLPLPLVELLGSAPGSSGKGRRRCLPAAAINAMLRADSMDIADNGFPGSGLLRVVQGRGEDLYRSASVCTSCDLTVR